jgi:hypothetical protein
MEIELVNIRHRTNHPLLFNGQAMFIARSLQGVPGNNKQATIICIVLCDLRLRTLLLTSTCSRLIDFYPTIICSII